MSVSSRPFTAFETHTVAEFADPGNDNFCETVDDERGLEFAKDEALRIFYTTYGYRPHDQEPDTDGGLFAISDFDDPDDARALAAALADGKPVEDYIV